VLRCQADMRQGGVYRAIFSEQRINPRQVRLDFV
jgi:hypothetical protein